ncbi:collagen alpha-1(I) chain-like [Symphalangus syndactylus]|uniref:collagen alpha-1(I) chain-like n=1 Tax=Symphalangus syndactylus TaxID=9590 RepID=UPI003005DC3A
MPASYFNVKILNCEQKCGTQELPGHRDERATGVLSASVEPPGRCSFLRGWPFCLKTSSDPARSSGKGGRLPLVDSKSSPSPWARLDTGWIAEETGGGLGSPGRAHRSPGEEAGGRGTRAPLGPTPVFCPFYSPLHPGAGGAGPGFASVTYLPASGTRIWKGRWIALALILPGPVGRSGGCGAAALLEGASVGGARGGEADPSPARLAAEPRARLGARSSELGGRPRRPGDKRGGVTRRAPLQERGATWTLAGGLPRDARGLQASSCPAGRLCPPAPELPVQRVLPVLGSASGVWIPDSACRERACQPTRPGPHDAAPAGPQPQVVADCQLGAHCTAARPPRAHRAEVGPVPPLGWMGQLLPRGRALSWMRERLLGASRAGSWSCGPLRGLSVPAAPPAVRPLQGARNTFLSPPGLQARAPAFHPLCSAASAVGCLGRWP